MNHLLLSPESISTSSSACSSPLDSPDNFQESLNKYTSDQIAKAEEFEGKAEKRINGWWSALFGSSYKDAAELYLKAADHYKLSKSWDKVAEMHLKLAGCYLKLDLEDTRFIDFKHKAFTAYLHAGDIYKNISAKDARSCYNQAVGRFLEIGSFHKAGLFCKEIGKLYEVEQYIEKAILYFERAADLYQRVESFPSTDRCNQCKHKVAQFSAQLEQYPRAIAIYEDFAKQSLNKCSRSSVTGYLLNAGLCQLAQLCKADAAAISNALERYEELDPTFPGTRAYKFLADLAASLDEEDVQKFNDAVKKFHSLTKQDLAASVDEEHVQKLTDVFKKFGSVTKQDAWKTTLLMKIVEKLKAKKTMKIEQKLKAMMEK